MKKALVVAMVMVMGLGVLAFAGPMSGSFTTDICFSIDASDGDVSVSDFSSELTIDYTVCGWTFESVSTFGLTGWETQEFTAYGVLGAFTLGSDLVFDPMNADFTSWDSTVAVSIAGLSISGEFLLEDDGAGWAFGIGGSAAACALSANIYFNSYLDAYGNLAVQTPEFCFCFTSVDITASFPFCCIELVDVNIGFSAAKGFDSITFSLDGVAVPGMGWLVYDLALTFQAGDDGKTLSVTPGVDFGDVDACIDFGIELMTIGTAITGINVYSIGLECDMGQGVTFSSLSYLDFPNHKFNPSGSSAICCEWYWERFTISSSSDACCGGGFEFDLAVYFGADSYYVKEDPGCCSDGLGVETICDPAHDWLFDVARIDASFSIGLGSNFSLTGGLTLQDLVWDVLTKKCVPGGVTGVCVGFEVSF
jgi:hypothetical protein